MSAGARHPYHRTVAEANPSRAGHTRRATCPRTCGPAAARSDRRAWWGAVDLAATDGAAAAGADAVLVAAAATACCCPGAKSLVTEAASFSAVSRSSASCSAVNPSTSRARARVSGATRSQRPAPMVTPWPSCWLKSSAMATAAERGLGGSPAGKLWWLASTSAPQPAASIAGRSCRRLPGGSGARPRRAPAG